MAKKKIIKFECVGCDVHVCFNKSEFTVTSTDQAAVFIAVPQYQCDKCKSVCMVSEHEVEDGRS